MLCPCTCVLCVVYYSLSVCVCLCVCSYVHVFLHTCLHACKWGRTHKVLVCAGRHKARPPIPLFLFPGGEIRQSVYLPAPSRRGAGAPGWEVIEVAGWGQSSRVYRLDVSVGGLKEGDSHFWHSYAYLAPVWPAVMFILTSMNHIKKSHSQYRQWLKLHVHTQSIYVRLSLIPFTNNRPSYSLFRCCISLCNQNEQNEARVRPVVVIKTCLKSLHFHCVKF